MKKFIVVIANKWNDIIVFKTEAPNKSMLFGPWKEPSKYLIEKMKKDSYLFGEYNEDQMLACTVKYIEEIDNIITI